MVKPLFCTNCGEPVGAGSFCVQCGTALTPPPELASQTAPPPLPELPATEPQRRRRGVRSAVAAAVVLVIAAVAGAVVVLASRGSSGGMAPGSSGHSRSYEAGYKAGFDAVSGDGPTPIGQPSSAASSFAGVGHASDVVDCRTDVAANAAGSMVPLGDNVSQWIGGCIAGMDKANEESNAQTAAIGGGTGASGSGRRSQGPRSGSSLSSAQAAFLEQVSAQISGVSQKAWLSLADNVICPDLNLESVSALTADRGGLGANVSPAIFAVALTSAVHSICTQHAGAVRRFIDAATATTTSSSPSSPRTTTSAPAAPGSTSPAFSSPLVGPGIPLALASVIEHYLEPTLHATPSMVDDLELLAVPSESTATRIAFSIVTRPGMPTVGDNLGGAAREATNGTWVIVTPLRP